MSVKQTILQRLDALQIPYEHYEHEAAYTMEDCLRLPYAAPDVMFCKNILLCNRQKTAYYLYVTPPAKPFRTAVVSKLLGVSRLSFAPAEDLPGLLSLTSGSLSPLALWLDEGRRVTLVIDRDVQKEGRIAFHPCDNTATVLFDQAIFFSRVVPALGANTVYLSTEDR
ncbi:MAG: prolyl-tRNA synthetase associated domain-containing protein [Clostridia bacterium]|nr:prolyl-tRNA synthetase associated domain-containing protein [Clostridia bacterium]